MPGLNLHQYWRRPIAVCTGLPKAIPFERLDPPVPVANSGTMYIFCFIVSHLVCTSVARSTPESHLGPHESVTSALATLLASPCSPFALSPAGLEVRLSACATI